MHKGEGLMLRRLITAVAATMVVGVLAVPVAQADTGDIIAPQNVPHTAADGWQAGTCTTDTPQCSPVTPAQFYTKAAGHPQIGFTQYTIKLEEYEAGKTIPIGSAGTIRVDLPPGLTVNPEATINGEGKPVRCTLAEFEEKKPADPFESPNCPATTQVGEEQLTLKVIAGPGKGTEVPPTPSVTKVPLYNLVPAAGEPALFGFKLGAPGAKKSVFLKTDIAWESDYHAGFTIELPTPNPGTLSWKRPRSRKTSRLSCGPDLRSKSTRGSRPGRPRSKLRCRLGSRWKTAPRCRSIPPSKSGRERTRSILRPDRR
jgi:hypothetical protein